MVMHLALYLAIFVPAFVAFLIALERELNEVRRAVPIVSKQTPQRRY